MYSRGHMSSSSKGKCVICGKKTSTYVSIGNISKNGWVQLGAKIEIPACDGECFKKVAEKTDILIAYTKNINNLVKEVK